MLSCRLPARARMAPALGQPSMARRNPMALLKPHDKHICRSSLFTDAPDSMDLQSYLTGQGFESNEVDRMLFSKPELAKCSLINRVIPLCQYLQQMGLSQETLQTMVHRCPALFLFDLQRRVIPAIDFLREDLSMDDTQVLSTIQRFPYVLGMDVKAHLRPHLSYVTSLGVPSEELKDLVLCRPQVLGLGIERLVTYLHKYFLIPRHLVAKLLRSYPFDYNIPVTKPLRYSVKAVTTQDDDDDDKSEGPQEQGSKDG